MKHAVILGHPNPESFAASVARTYCKAAEAAGHSVVLRDLYRMGFNPCLGADEIPKTDYAPGADVAAEREALSDVDVFVLVYPLWLYAPPAIVLGYVQRVFGMGFGYAPGLMGNRPLLAGRKLLSFTSSGAPVGWLKRDGGLEALRALFDGHLAATCGMSVLDHVHFGHVVPSADARTIEGYLATVRERAELLSATEAYAN